MTLLESFGKHSLQAYLPSYCYIDVSLGVSISTDQLYDCPLTEISATLFEKMHFLCVPLFGSTFYHRINDFLT